MTKEIYNEFYKEHGAGVHSDPIRFGELKKLCGGRVLDIGCGTGDLADYYKGEYMGIDISDVAILLAEKTRRETARFFVGNLVEEFTLEKEKFDTFVIAEVLEHIEDDTILMENVKKMASPNAKIIISVPNGDRVPDKNHLREFTVPELRKKFSPLGRVRFHNWIGFDNRILMSIQMGEKVGNDLALSMIVWNEDKGLENAILSCIDFVDQVVISVDNKSDDGTLKIAERYADVIKRHEWENDFAKGRNFVDEGIKTKWILSLDGHEFVEEAPNLEEKLKSNADGLLIRVKMESGDDFINPRIYRSGNVWTHAIHNQIVLEKKEKYTEFIIIHDREGSQSDKSIKERLEQVKTTMEVELKKELKIKGSEIRALFYLARYYRQFYKWKKAVRYYKKYMKKSPFKAEKWLCGYEGGTIANAMNKHLLALKFFTKANKEIPNRWEIKKQMGLTYLLFNQFEKSLYFLTESLDRNKGEFTFNPEKRDDGETWDKIGFCYFQMEKHLEAKIAWQRSIKIGTNKMQKKVLRQRIEFMERNGLA